MPGMRQARGIEHRPQQECFVALGVGDLLEASIWLQPTVTAL